MENRDKRACQSRDEQFVVLSSSMFVVPALRLQCFDMCKVYTASMPEVVSPIVMRSRTSMIVAHSDASSSRVFTTLTQLGQDCAIFNQ